MSNDSCHDRAFACGETSGLSKLEYAAIHIATGHVTNNDDRTFEGDPGDTAALEDWRRGLREEDAKYCVDTAEAILSECEKRSKP